jgi:hypothetical protein
MFFECPAKDPTPNSPLPTEWMKIVGETLQKLIRHLGIRRGRLMTISIENKKFLWRRTSI